jgi:hypothetical protein
MISNIEDYLLEHPLVQSSTDLEDLIFSAQAKLAQAYQSVNMIDDHLTINSLISDDQYTVSYSGDLPEYTEPTLSQY